MRGSSMVLVYIFCKLIFIVHFFIKIIHIT
nr:MAG TPA: hypothetical protein [Bacteriophage sp.]